jgi:hypothetical protein
MVYAGGNLLPAVCNINQRLVGLCAIALDHPATQLLFGSIQTVKRFV